MAFFTRCLDRLKWCASSKRHVCFLLHSRSFVRSFVLLRFHFVHFVRSNVLPPFFFFNFSSFFFLVQRFLLSLFQCPLRRHCFPFYSFLRSHLLAADLFPSIFSSVFFLFLRCFGLLCFCLGTFAFYFWYVLHGLQDWIWIDEFLMNLSLYQPKLNCDHLYTAVGKLSFTRISEKKQRQKT